MAELKKCPFCGKRTVKIIPFDNGKYIISHWHENISDCPIAVADEDTGIGTTYFETEEEAIETWNNRVTEADIRAKVYEEAVQKLYALGHLHSRYLKSDIKDIAEQLKEEQ